MSAKQLALESIQRLPDDVNLAALAGRLKFLAGIRNGLDPVEPGNRQGNEGQRNEGRDRTIPFSPFLCQTFPCLFLNCFWAVVAGECLAKEWEKQSAVFHDEGGSS